VNPCNLHFVQFTFGICATCSSFMKSHFDITSQNTLLLKISKIHASSKDFSNSIALVTRYLIVKLFFRKVVAHSCISA